ncbi:MAG: 4-hydroxy-tetrahydrodipicolinate synthase [Gorillibacterium sp.]|nr:4-hydroxy-tetrahydrodipicolinate synthase [Gorillibacterium sp.]
MDFGRVITAMVTPFDNELDVDWAQLEKLVNYLIIEQKSTSLVVCGTTGETSTLSDEEKIQLFKMVVQHAAGRCKVIAGSGSNETAHSVRLTREAELVGVDGILAVTPYYVRPSQEGLYQHFRAIAEVTTLPIILYNIPGRSAVNLEPETTLRLAGIPNIIASKEAHCDFDHLTRLINEAPEGFRIYCGEDTLTLPFLSIGVYGVISVASHIVGIQMRELIHTYLNGDVAQAASLHRKLHPILRGMFFCPHRVPSPAPIKCALRLRDLDVGGVRLPLVPVNQAEENYIRELLINHL